MGETNNWFEPNEFFLGATLEINKHKFKLLQADESTLKFMEGDTQLFPCADIDRISKQLSQIFENKSVQLRRVFRKLDEDKNGRLSYEEFKNFLWKSGFQLNEHEITTLARRYDTDGNGEINFVEFARLVQGSDLRGE